MVERIKEKCKQLGTSMGALEKELGFANGSIRRWDERVPGIDRAYLLANRLGVSIEWILTGKEAADLTPDEQQLVDLYRATDERGRRRIRQTAELEAQEQKSSISKIG